MTRRWDLLLIVKLEVVVGLMMRLSLYDTPTQCTAFSNDVGVLTKLWACHSGCYSKHVLVICTATFVSNTVLLE